MGLLLLLLLLLIIVFRNPMVYGEMIAMTYSGRYLLFTMSLFSMYCGLIYCEFFAIPIQLFGDSTFEKVTNEKGIEIYAWSGNTYVEFTNGKNSRNERSE